MKKVAVIIALSIALSGFSVLAADSISDPNYPGVSKTELSVEDDWMMFFEVMVIFDKFYYKDISHKEFTEKILKGGIASIDRFSQYLAPEEAGELADEREGFYSGVGMSLGEKNENQETLIEVVGVLENSPAEKAGIKAGDIIVAVSSGGIKKDAVNARSMSIPQLIPMIKGKAKTKVYLLIRRGSEYIDFIVERGEVIVQKISSSVIKDGIGYVKLIDFIRTETDSDFINKVNALKEKGIKCLIIDLRNNPGGLLNMAVGISVMFRNIEFERFRNPPIVSLEGKKFSQDVRGPILQSGIFKDLKVVILTNGSSASASEIVTAYLKHYCGAKVVGTKTYGKGVGQGVYDLKNGGVLIMTSFEYFVGPDRVPVHGRGILPNYVIENGKNDKEDPQMKKAVEVAEEMLGK